MMEYITSIAGLPKEYLIGIFISIALGAFAKFCPKEKIAGPIRAISNGMNWLVRKVSELLLAPSRLAGVALSRLLLNKLGKNAAAKLEEGLFVTLSLWVEEILYLVVSGLNEVLAILPNAVTMFREGLVSDNEKEEDNKK